MLRNSTKSRGGFTLVELLIVIVVIVILSAMSIVIYNGISNRATDSLVKSDLLSNSKRMQYYIIEHGEIPTGPETADTDPDIVSYRFELSKRNSYKVFQFWTARINSWDPHTTEALLIAISSSDKIFAYPITKDSISQVAVSDEADELLRSTDGLDNRSGATLLLQKGTQIAEGRRIIRIDGAVEGGFVIIKG